MVDNFWQALPDPFFVLAPMEDTTDVAFRHVIAKAGRPDVFFTEFTSTDAFASEEGRHSTDGRLYFTEDEQPIVAHIWGDRPDRFALMSRAMADRGFAGVDINMGCPAPNVFKSGKGAGLILRPDRAGEIIQASKEAGLPVSVKTRLGHNKVDEYQDWLPFLFDQGLANLTIHLRTKVEMSKAPAHYDVLADIIQIRDDLAPDTLLTVNGDIANRQEGLALVEQYPGINGVMIGRGVFTDPYAFAKEAYEPTPRDYIRLFRYHLDLFEYFSSKVYLRPFKALRRSYKIYIRGFRGANDLRAALMEVDQPDQVRKLLDDFEAGNEEILDGKL